MAPFVLLLLLFLCEAASAEDETSVNPGDDVTLTCRSADPNIRDVKWTRTDLESEHALLSIDGHFISRNQHPSFQDRVQLVDRDLKDGDASLTLKNVKSSDEGTYECQVRVDNSTQQKTSIFNDQPIRRVRLHVADVISLRPGDDVILPCRSADPNIRAVEWTRTDLEPEEYVFLYRDGHLQPEKQHPSFQGRVKLMESDLKDGDVSLTLKNMKSSDEGTYECRVTVGGSTRQIFNDQPIRRIRLHVAEVMSVNPGDDVILPCRSADPSIRAVKWTRTDPKPDLVLLSIDGHFIPENQHESFQDRVQLVDRDLKDGDVSLTLKNMKSSDEGTYECRVKVGGSKRQKRSIIDDQAIRRVRLHVAGSDRAAMKDGGRTAVVNGILGFIIFVLAIVIAVFGFIEIKRQKPEAAAAAADEAE